MTCVLRIPLTCYVCRTMVTVFYVLSQDTTCYSETLFKFIISGLARKVSVTCQLISYGNWSNSARKSNTTTSNSRVYKCVRIDWAITGRYVYFPNWTFSLDSFDRVYPYEISMRVDHTFTIILIIRDERLKMYLYCVHLSMYEVLRKWNLLRSDLPWQAD